MSGKNKTYISTEQFIRNYMSASSAEEVANTLGVDVKYILKRSNQLRKNGINLHELSCNYTPLRSGRKSIDTQQILKLVKECQKASNNKNIENTLTSNINKAIDNAD